MVLFPVVRPNFKAFKQLIASGWFTYGLCGLKPGHVLYSPSMICTKNRKGIILEVFDNSCFSLLNICRHEVEEKMVYVRTVRKTTRFKKKANTETFGLLFVYGT